MSDTDSDNDEEFNDIVNQLGDNLVPNVEIPKNFVEVEEIKELYNISSKSTLLKKKEMLMENLFSLCCTLAYEEVSKNKGQLAKLDIWSNLYTLFY